MYDKFAIKDRLKTLRINRRNLYKENKAANINPYEKYSCCKSQTILAEELGVERRTIGKWENGQSLPSLENLIALSDLLDCSIEYFLGTGDLPEINPIAKASHYSGISPVIIKYGLENPDYLDCLNFFMLPDNCGSLFNTVTLSAWKTYWINQELSNIKNPLKDTVKSIFEQFNAVTPFNQITKEKYKEFMIKKLPEEKIVFSSKRTERGVNIKSCLTLQNYLSLSLSDTRESRYEDFINYLVEYTYEPLMNSTFLELQKEKLSKVFATLFTRYLTDL